MPEGYGERAEEYNRAAEEYFRAVSGESLERWPYLAPSLFAQAAWRAGAIIGVLGPTPGDTVLDFGCGNGWASLWLNRCGVRTVCIDVSSTAVEIARDIFNRDPLARMNLDPLFLPYDGKKLPLEDNSVDRVIAIDAFHHVPDWESVFGELYRVLRKGGKVGIADVGSDHSRSAPARFEARHYGILERDVDCNKLAEAAQSAGFDRISILPLAQPGSVIFDLDMRERFLSGDRELYPIQPLQDAIKSSTFILIEKGREILDSRHPGMLKHRIDAGPERIEAGPGESITLTLTVHNEGDTVWLAEEKHNRGIRPAARLYDSGGKLVEMDWWEGMLGKDVQPGGSCEIEVSVPVPTEPGEYMLEFDLKWLDFHLECMGSEPATVKLRFLAF